MNEAIELLHTVIKKHQERSNLILPEKIFIKEVTAMVEELRKDDDEENTITLAFISKLREKVNLLIEKLNNQPKNLIKIMFNPKSIKREEILEDLIPVILFLKVQIFKEVFEDVNLDHAKNLIRQRNYPEANKLLANAFIGVSEKIFSSQEELSQLTEIWNKLFADQNDPSSEIVIAPPGTSASLNM